MTPAELPPFKIVRYRDHKTTKPVGIETMPWLGPGGIVEMMGSHKVTNCAPCPGGQKCDEKKFNGAFSPGILRDGTERENANVEYVSMLVFDIDHVTPEELQGVCDRLEGLESVLSSTHSHKPHDCCVRIVLPFSRPLNPDEFRHVYRSVRKRYQLEWTRSGSKKRVGADPSTKDISRLYFLPTVPAGSEPLFGYESGALLDLDELLDGVGTIPQATDAPALLSSVAVAIRTESTGPVDMEALRAILRGYRPPHSDEDEDEVISKKELVRRVVDGDPLVRFEETGLRDSSCHRIAKILAYKLPVTTPESAVVELVRRSVASMPTYEGDGEADTLEARFNTVRRSWAKGMDERLAQAAVYASERAQNDRLREMLRGLLKSRSTNRPRASSIAPEESKESEESETEPSDAEILDQVVENWRAFLVTVENKKGLPEAKNIPANAEVALAFSPEWVGVLKYNEVTKDVLTRGGPLEDFENKPAQVISGVSYWLQRHKELKLSLRKNDVMDAIMHVAKRNSFDPLKDYLNSLEWDGTERIDTFLEDYCNASTVDGNGNDITHLVRRISRCWLLGAVARALAPGCKMDTVLILEGDQGAKKSTMLDVLGGEWFADSVINIADKDSKMLAGRSWIVEMPELSAMHASETEAQKAFFSSRVDKFRPPYGYAIEEFPRRCVFVGSTNDERYMNDITGNRRYWPVRCGDLLIRLVQRDRNQIWAQAVAVYKAGFACAACAAHADGEDRCEKHRWWFTKEENKTLEGVNNQRLKNEFAEAVSDYVLKLAPAQRPRAFSVFEIATKILGISSERINSQQGPIGRALKTLGFTKERPMVNGSREVLHVVPREMLNAPQRPAGSLRHLNVVPSPKPTSPRPSAPMSAPSGKPPKEG